MNKQILCKGNCGNKFLKSDLLEYNKKFYCKNCYDVLCQKNKLNAYIDKICQDEDNKTPNNKTLIMRRTQIKRALEQGFTYEDIFIGLKYAKEVLKVEFNSTSGLGYGINNISKAKAYYRNNEYILELTEKDLQVEVREVYIKPHLISRYDEKKMISWEGVIN